MILNKKSPLLYKLQGRACIRGTTLIITKCDIFISINAASRLYVLLFPKRYSGTASQPVSRVFPPTTPLYKTLDSYYFPSQYLDLLFIVLTNFCLDLIHIYYNKKNNFSILSAYFDSYILWSNKWYYYSLYIITTFRY